MKNRATALAVGALALALTLAGCTSSSTSAPTGSAATIAIGSLYEPTNLSNVDGGGQGITEAFNGNVYEGLFKLGDTGKVTPLLAKSYTASSNGLTYTFDLRSGVHFHDGGTMTSADVKSSIERVMATDSQSARKSSFDVVKSIATPDDTTVVVKLKTRSISFVYNLSYIWIVPASDTKLATDEDGTGPYSLDQWKRGSSLTLTRYAKYWGAKAKNAGVEFDYFTNAGSLTNALASGQVDIVTSIQSPDALTQFENNADYTITNGQSTTKELLAFNDRVKPFNQVDVRKAVYSAIDRKKLLSSIWGKYGTLIGSMVPPSDPWYEDLTSVNPYSPTLAKKLLAKAGYPNGFTFTLDTPTYDPHPAVAQFLQSELKKVGITVKINSISADEWYTKVYKNHDFTATLQEHVNDRDIVFYGDPSFYWGYDNKTVITDVKKAEQAKTAAGQTALLKKVNEQIAADAASAWLYLYPQIVVADSDVSGYPVNGLNSQFYAYDIVTT